MTTSPVLDSAGRRRSPATMPGYHAGRPPRNKGRRYPADPPTVEEIVGVMRQVGGGRHGARLRAVIVVLWRGGLRIQEALALSERDLDPHRGSILVHRGKGGRRREVGMDEWGFEQLRPWLADRERLPVGPLFCVIDGPTRGRPWSAAGVRVEFRKLAARAGVRRRFAPHQLRHAHAIELAREGVPLNIIQRQLGHANLGTTSIYLQGIDTEEIIAAVHGRRAPMMPASAACGFKHPTPRRRGRQERRSRFVLREREARRAPRRLPRLASFAEGPAALPHLLATMRKAKQGPLLFSARSSRQRGRWISRAEIRSMSDQSAIEWTEATWNPVTGCDQVSPGCAHCYAKTFAERWKGVPSHPYEQGFALRLWPERLEHPLKWRRPRRIFVNSMSDLFHERVPDDFIARVFDVMVEADHHVFQVLTKRPDRLANLADGLLWPSHIWMGVSIENRRFVHRADRLREVPAAVRFISAEPLLGPLEGLDLTDIDWLIAGGESGPGHRRVDESWLLDLRDQCADDGVAFFFKQWGGHRPKSGGRELAGRTWNEYPGQLVPA